jgi:hypothetical protein
MSYCALSDVQGLMQATFSATSRPTADEVDSIITNIAAEIDGVAQAAGYEVPVTTAQAIAMLKTYNAYGAAVAAWHAGFISDALPPRVEYWNTSYRDFLSRLRKGEQQLPGASITGEEDIAFEIAPQYQRDSYWSESDETSE